MTSEIRTDRGGRHDAAAPPLDPESEANGGGPLAVLYLRQPSNRLGRELKLAGGLREREPTTLAMFRKKHAGCSPEVNIRSSADFHSAITDRDRAFSHDVNMAAPDRPLWFLQEWFATQGLIQRDLITKLDWLPAKANKVWHGVQIAKLDEVAEIADLLQIASWELLMAPEEAMRLRRLRSVLAEVASPAPAPSEGQAGTRRTGTNG